MSNIYIRQQTPRTVIVLCCFNWAACWISRDPGWPSHISETKDKLWPEQTRLAQVSTSWGDMFLTSRRAAVLIHPSSDQCKLTGQCKYTKFVKQLLSLLAQLSWFVRNQNNSWQTWSVQMAGLGQIEFVMTISVQTDMGGVYCIINTSLTRS